MENTSSGTLNTNNGMVSVELGRSPVLVTARGKFRDKDAADFVPTPESLFLQVDTPNYDGPLDLLLHLIRKHSIDIFDIPIVFITKKYLEALDEMQALDLDVAGEFILMAASLAQIKSKMLLPKEEQIQEEDEEEGEDPRKALIKKLLIYKSYKEASLELMKRPRMGQDWHLRPASIDDDFDESDEDFISKDQEIAPIEIYEIMERFSSVMLRTQKHSLHTIKRDRISVSGRIRDLINFCQVRPKFTFYDALKFFPIYEKVDIIVTFLALLEMSRLKLLKLNLSSKFELDISVDKENFYQKQTEILENIEDSQIGDDAW